MGKSWSVIATSAPLLLCTASIASAQDYPTKPVRIIVAAPGGGSDFAARIVAQAIAQPLGQQVIIDYRGSGVLATDYTAKSPPDGYTLHVTGALLWLLPLVRPTPYDAVRDFAPITLINQEPGILVVHPSLPVKSVKDLIALAKAHPGELNYGSSGVGTTSHLVSELFNSMAHIKLGHVPYKGSLARIAPLMSGEVQVAFLDTSAIGPTLKSGKLRALAVTSVTPSLLFPELPTIAGSGVPGYESVGRTGIWAPVKTSDAIVNRLNQEIVRAVNLPNVKDQFLKSGVEPIGTTPDQFSSMIKSEIVRMTKVVKEMNIKAE